MKRVSMIAFLLMFGLVAQTQAVGSSSNQGAKAGQVDTTAQVQSGSVVQTQEQNQVRNQGEETQLQTQEQNQMRNQEEGVETQAQKQNATQVQGGNANKNSQGKSNSNPSEQRRSEVADAVKNMLQIADRDGGIGQQVRIVAQNQNQNQLKLEQDIEKIQSRGSITKFFFGANYGEINDAKKTLEQNKEQIRQLNQVKNKLSNQGDQQQLTEQIRVLEQANQDIETLITDAQKGFSLFGWLNKLIS